MSIQPGSIVRCRNRDWVLLPDARQDLLLLRPLTGATDELVAIHKQLTDLIGYDLPEERVRSATFPLPVLEDLSDAASAHLLWQAARLTLREGATPFRSLGRISVRPRTYQFVPLLMALRLDPVRLLIADDVGVGKTIEALLVAREMLDRGEVKRLCVLCPPYLCEQWQKELVEKANLDAVVIRSGTINQLERAKASQESIYQHYPVQVASIDFVKSDRNRHLFLLDCPELVIVDEAHGVAVAAGGNESQHQRHELVRQLASTPDRHLILLTATPHSGIESAFRCLLSLLRPEFGTWDPTALPEPQRIELARHFVQRTRRDIEQNWEGADCFPRRVPLDETYPLSREYQELFSRTYDFCYEMVRSGDALAGRQQRVRHWAALALLRCVMSSPAAAAAALGARQDVLGAEEDEPDFRSMVYESAEDRTDDAQPTPALESATATLADPDRRRLRDLGRLATSLLHTQGDTKLRRCGELAASLLREGFHPILWCRYVATAEYLAESLQSSLEHTFPGLRVMAITGRIGRDPLRSDLVVTLLNLHRPRDRSHYERFAAFHQSFYRAVEVTSVIPFPSRALDRGLAGAAVGLARHAHLTNTPPLGARAIHGERPQLELVIDTLVARMAAYATDVQPAGVQRLRERTVDLLGEWSRIAQDYTAQGVSFQYHQAEAGAVQPLVRDLLDRELPSLPPYPLEPGPVAHRPPLAQPIPHRRPPPTLRRAPHPQQRLRLDPIELSPPAPAAAVPFPLLYIPLARNTRLSFPVTQTNNRRGIYCGKRQYRWE